MASGCTFGESLSCSWIYKGEGVLELWLDCILSLEMSLLCLEMLLIEVGL